MAPPPGNIPSPSLVFDHLLSRGEQVKLSLNGLQMLLNYEVVPPSEAKSILRILSTQVPPPSLPLLTFSLPLPLPLLGSIWKY